MGNKITCGFCPIYNDMTLDKKESFLMHEQYENNQIMISTRALRVKASIDEKANKIQISFRKLKSLKLLSNNYFEKLTNLAATENFKITELSKNNFIAKIDKEIKDILTNKIGITTLEKTNIHYITHNFKNIPNDKIFNDLKIFRIQLDPIMITNNNTNQNEFYWGEWNLSYKKHGFGFLITSKNDFYLGTFKDNVIDGVGLLIINNCNLPKIETNNFSIDSDKNPINFKENKNNKKIDNAVNQKFLKNENNNENYQGNVNNYNNLNNIKNNNFSKNSNLSLINSNPSNTFNSNSNPNSYNKAQTDSLYQKETLCKTLDEKNLNEFSNNLVINCGGNKINQNLQKQKIESESLFEFIDNEEQEKNYESKMSDFSKKMISFLKDPQNKNFINCNNSIDNDNNKDNKVVNANNNNNNYNNINTNLNSNNNLIDDANLINNNNINSINNSNSINNINTSLNINNKITNNENKKEMEISDNEKESEVSKEKKLACEIYIGEFKRGVADGYGRLFSRTGEWYIGYFKNNKKHGEGELHFADGSFYIGTFNNNSIEGEGKYFFSNGSNFSGNFKNGKFCGKGKMAWNDGRRYNGHWDNHNLSGEGMHLWPNENIFQGNYKLNAKSGKGVFYWNENKFYEGDFLNNKINGKGLFEIGNYVLKGAWKFGKLSFINDVRLKNRAFTYDEVALNNGKSNDFLLMQKPETKEVKSKYIESNSEVLPVINEN